MVEGVEERGSEQSTAGWGVGALLGEQTRPHNDLDVIVDLDDLPSCGAALGEQGFRLTEGEPPLCFVLAGDHGHMVDVHPVAFDEQGDGHYTMAGGRVWVYPAAGFAGTGTVEGQPVRCLTAQQPVGRSAPDRPSAEVTRSTRAFPLWQVAVMSDPDGCLAGQARCDIPQIQYRAATGHSGPARQRRTEAAWRAVAWSHDRG